MLFRAFWIGNNEKEPLVWRTLSDVELLSLYQRTLDDHIIIILLRRVESRNHSISRICLKYLQDEALRDDFCQDLFFQLQRKLRHAEVKKNFSPWLKKVVANLCIDKLRKVGKEEGKRVPMETLVVKELPTVKMENSFGEHGEFNLKEMIKSTLNDQQWLVIEKRFFEEKSYKECAEELNLTYNEFKGRFQRAMKKICNELGPEILTKMDLIN